MLTKIVDGISEKLNAVFGGDYSIYTEAVEQGASLPCFFIQLVDTANTRILGGRFLREHLFCVQYIPASDEPKAECTRMQDALFIALQYIIVDGGLQRGVKMHGEFVDGNLKRGAKLRGAFVGGVLNFFVNYDILVRETEDKALMGTLHIAVPLDINNKEAEAEFHFS